MLKQVIETLNQVEVKGKENMDMLLGCILTLEAIQGKIDSMEKTTKEAEEKGGVTDGK